ncbi:MAG: hypothetical protein RL685_396 [Pseudomonadota bacterium]
MAEAKTYAGSCHCGNVRYQVSTDLKQVLQCNCSICSRTGYLLTFVQPEQFQLLSGEEQLSDYQFNRMNVHHLFCSNCGVRGFGRGTGPGGKPMYAINVRCLDGVDVSKLELTSVDGKSM